MSNLTIQENSCSLSEDIITYIYDEMPLAERLKYESHLTGCSVCAQELEGFSNASQMIQLWRKDAFEGLATPEIRVGSFSTDLYLPKAAAQTGWFSGIQAFFNYPRIATVGFAFGALIIAAVIAGTFLVAGYRSDELAKNEYLSNVQPNIVNAQITNGADQRNTGTEPTATTKNIEPSLSENVVSKEPVNQPASSVERLRPRAASRPRVEYVTNKQNVSLRSSDSSPRLSQYEEYKDESIRLSDLMDDFDELGAS